MPGGADQQCRWGYWSSIKNVAMVMVVLVVVGMIFSLITGNIGGLIGDALGSAIFGPLILLSLIPLILVTVFTYNTIWCWST